MLLVSAMVYANEPANQQNYRIAGIIASDSTQWRAIIELPDGKQQLVSEGDFLGPEEKGVEVVKISQDGVSLRFAEGERQMQLSQGERQPMPQDVLIPLPQPTDTSTGFSYNDAIAESAEGGTGVDASDFSKQVVKQLTPKQLENVNGLEALSGLSESARVVSYNYIGAPDNGYYPIKSVDSGVDQLKKAIEDGEGMRLVVNGDPNHPHIYILPPYKEAGL